MADIDVERKGASIWPWILGLLLLALLVWAGLELFGDGDGDPIDDPVVAPVTAPPPTAADTGALSEPVRVYLAQCTETQGTPSGQMGLGHAYTVSCLRHLREGLAGVVGDRQLEDANVSARLAQYDSTVQRLEASDTTATTHSGLTRDAATTAAGVMAAIQEAWYASDAQIAPAVSEVEQAADGIDGGVPMLDQREAVQRFFREAGEALRMIGEQPGAAAGP